MPSFGTKPDCVHCQYMLHQKNGEYRCRQHDTMLHTPILIFCNRLEPPTEMGNEDYEDWFADALAQQDLDANTLYTWVETTTRDQQGASEIHIDAEIIAPIKSYTAWSARTFWQVLRNVRETKREFYRQHGYDILD